MNTSNIVSVELNNNNALSSVAPSGSYNFPVLSGIDTLYYFITSNDAYQAFYTEISNKIEFSKELNGGYVPKDSLKITISDKEFVYHGKSEGFHFFGDGAGWLRIGFKDPNTNKGVHDIRVQLQGVGIYLLTIKKLCDYINFCLLDSITQPFYYVTRADFNIFCQYDLGSHIKQEEIITRKRKFIKYIGTKSSVDTMYIGKPPSRFRIYNKFKELDPKTGKYYYMDRYFKDNGFEIKDPLWNLEIECHREFLKQYGIDTLDDLLHNAESMFHRCMEMVRLADLTTISEKDRIAGRLHRAKTHPLWEYLDQSYSFKAFPQNTQRLERLIPEPREYNANHFIDDFRVLVKKGEENQIIIDDNQIREILRDSYLCLTRNAKEVIKPFIPIIFETDQRKYLLTKNKTAVATLPKNLENETDKEIQLLEGLSTKALHQELFLESEKSKKHSDTGLIIKNLQVITKEIDRRRAGQKELELWQQ